MQSHNATKGVSADACGRAANVTHVDAPKETPDTQYCEGFRQILQFGGLKIVLCPPRVPQCNAYAERFVRTIKAEFASPHFLERTTPPHHGLDLCRLLSPPPQPSRNRKQTDR